MTYIENKKEDELFNNKRGLMFAVVLMTGLLFTACGATAATPTAVPSQTPTATAVADTTAVTPQELFKRWYKDWEEVEGKTFTIVMNKDWNWRIERKWDSSRGEGATILFDGTQVDYYINSAWIWFSFDLYKRDLQKLEAARGREVLLRGELSISAPVWYDEGKVWKMGAEFSFIDAVLVGIK